jgi:hypothetical protein
MCIWQTCYCSQWMFENPTLNLSAIRNSCVKITCYLSNLIFTFIYSGSSIQMWVSISSRVATFLLYALHPNPQTVQQCNSAIVHNRLKQLYIGSRPEIRRNMTIWNFFYSKDRNSHLIKYSLTFPLNYLVYTKDLWKSGYLEQFVPCLTQV